MMKTCKMNGKITRSNVCSYGKYAYDWAIDKGIAKEQAPKVLPFRRIDKDNTLYERYSRSWVHI